MEKPKNIKELDSLYLFLTDGGIDWVEEEGRYFRYGAIRAKSKFEGNFDYNKGLLFIRIVTIARAMVNKTIEYSTLISISNYDDGVWQAYNPTQKSENLDEANKFTQKVYNHIKEWEEKNWGYNMPTEEEFNKCLMEVGMWGEFTG